MNLSLALVNFLDALFIVIALIYVLIASIKLVMAKKIPGSKLIFGTIIFTLFGAIASAGYPYIVEEDNVLMEAAIDLALGIAFFIGALGFWRLSKFAIGTSADTSLNQTRADKTHAG